MSAGRACGLNSRQDWSPADIAVRLMQIMENRVNAGCSKLMADDAADEVMHVWKRCCRARYRRLTPLPSLLDYGTVNSSRPLASSSCFRAWYVGSLACLCLQMFYCTTQDTTAECSTHEPVHLHESTPKTWLPEAYFLRAFLKALQPVPPLVLIMR